MAQIFCKYHPDTPARWVCRHCEINFCRDCIDDKSGGNPSCPVCHRQVESLGAGNVIKPFWQRFPKFFLYPANTSPMILLLGLTAAMLFLSLIPFGIWFLVVAYFVFLKYAYVALERTAQGILQPPELSYEVLGEEMGLPFKQLLIFVIMIFFVNFMDRVGMGVLATLLVSLLLPASVMVLAVRHEFFAALNPVLLVDVVRRIGGPYFALWGALYMLLLSEEVAAALLWDILPSMLVIPLANFINLYFMLIMFHLMGYVLYQYHEELGYGIVEEYSEVDSRATTVVDAVSPGIREVEILFQEGKLDEAKTRLVELIKNEPGNMVYRERLHKLLLNTADEAGMQEYSGDYIVRLMAENRPSEAQRVFSDCYKLNKAFKFGNARQRHQMAELLMKNGQARAALSLLSNLHRDFPEYEGIPDAYLLVATILCETFNEDAKASQVLDFVEKKYPHHPKIAEIKEYRKVLGSLSRPA